MGNGLTTKRMVEAYRIKFYKRDIDWKKFETYDYDNISSEEYALMDDELYSRRLEYIVSEMIGERTPEIIWFDSPSVLQVFIGTEQIQIPMDVVEKHFRKYLRNKGFNKKNYILKKSKVTNFWEIRLMDTINKEYDLVMSKPNLFRLFAEVVDYLRNEEE